MEDFLIIIFCLVGIIGTMLIPFGLFWLLTHGWATIVVFAAIFIAALQIKG